MRSKRVENSVLARKSAFESSSHFPLETETKISDLQLVVLYTTPEMTRAALQYAATLGNDLKLSVRLVDLEVVPFGCALDQPPIDPEFAKQRLAKIALESGVPIQGEVLYARDRDEALLRRLSPGSLVLIPVKGFWGRICRKRLMHNLIQHGHEVVMVPCK